MGREKDATGRFITKDYTGIKRESLTLTKRSTRKTLWEAVCDCGKIIQVRPWTILSGERKSCGCKRPGDNARIYTHLLSSARTVWRGKYRELDFDTFYRLSQQICTYCGRTPYRTRGEFTYNGLDRVDSSKPHTVDNVVPCCWDCNRMKGSMSRADFLSHIDRIHTHACAPLGAQAAGM